MEHVTPIYILSGFLGSGKTTLLSRLITSFKQQGLRPAIVMNEIGEVNIEGLVAGEEVPTAEMLSGCICCTIRSNLSSEIAMLIQREQPDVIVIEATGIANPMEILDAAAEASLYMRIDVKKLITVVDAAHLLHLNIEQKGKTYRLMQEQIRAASALVLNKMDQVTDQGKETVQQLVERWNPYAPIMPAVRCDIKLEDLLQSDPQDRDEHSIAHNREGRDAHEHTDKNKQANSHEHGHAHDSHDHVMSYTYYFSHPVNSVEFERLIAGLPRDVYRAKGILTFSDTNSRFLFQYAFRESDFMKITPQGQVPDVVVFIGEHFQKSLLREQLEKLEGKTSWA
ncbi:cobalamin biosynthesis protein [Paenibacillus sp. LC231]|uniref:CobW family GTP-binding protein n=1 Tax=Paenibacillus sp. LC231 TaxID=1120679 RepID=UPI0008DDFFD9|nr:GTP-binding protein [Paenibacillus sp. LC231]OIB02718.1 cobalamin biosynthesis protein [Paenibacillus sp. LC231]